MNIKVHVSVHLSYDILWSTLWSFGHKLFVCIAYFSCSAST